MNKVLNINSLIICALAGMILATFAQFIFVYISLLAYCVVAFFLICIVDLIRKTRYRNFTGTILARMFLVAIVALAGIYFLSQYYN